MVKPRYALAAALIALGMVGSSSLARAESAAPANVTVQADSSLGVIPSTAVGLNASVYDGHVRDAAVPGLVRDAGVKLMRWPGGSTADAYHWQTNSITPVQGGYADPSNTFDAYMGVASAA